MRKKIYTVSLMLALCMTTPAIAAPTAAESMTDESIAQEQSSNSIEGTAESSSEEMDSSEENESLEEAGIHAIDETEVETTTETIEESVAETTDDEATDNTEEDQNTSGIYIIEDHQLDEEGRATVETQFPEDAVFPYQITLSGGEGEVDFTIEYNGQQLLIKPGTYQVKSVRDGNNKKLTKGARLVITEDTDAVYLDFTNPNANENKFAIASFFTTNIVFLLLAGVAFIGIKKFCDYMGIKQEK